MLAVLDTIASGASTGFGKKIPVFMNASRVLANMLDMVTERT